MVTIEQRSYFVVLVFIGSLLHHVKCDIEVLSKQLSDKMVTEGDDVILNCTVTGRLSRNDRISWFVDWTPANSVEDHRFFFAEENRTDSNVMSPIGPHGVYIYQYFRIQNGVNETDAVHICLLQISGVTIYDAGTYRCSYFDSVSSKMQILFRGETNLFVTPNGMRPEIPPETTPLSSTVIVTGGRTDNSGTIAAVSVVLFLIIFVLIGIWAVYRYRRYRNDKRAKEMEIPTELPKTESGDNSYVGNVVGSNGNGSVGNAANTEHVITPVDDVPGVRLPPMMTQADTDVVPAYSLLNRPDSQIRNHLGEAPYDLPPSENTSNTNYVLTSISLPPSRQPSGNAAGMKSDYEVASVDWIEPQPPSRSTSRQAAARSTDLSYEIVAPDGFVKPSAPARSSSQQSSGGSHYLDQDNLAYMDDVSGRVYDTQLYSPDTQL